jgi:hypothetical protein
VHLVFGSPGDVRRPKRVVAALLDLGIETNAMQDGARSERAVSR